MKKSFGSGVLVLAMGLVATVAHASQFWSTNTNLKVATISVENNTDTLSNTFVQFDAAPAGITHNCSDTSGFWVLGGDQAAVDSMRATALAAKLAGRPVRVKWINGNSGFTSCAGGGTSGYPMARGLIVN